MLNTLVYNPRFYKGSQWVLYVPTLVITGDLEFSRFELLCQIGVFHQ